MVKIALAPLLALTAALGLASCGQPDQVHVDHGWVRLAAVKGHPAAAYFTLHGGTTDQTLISITTPVAVRAEMHESKDQGGVSTMVPLKKVALPAHGAVKFEPGGKHLMLFDLNPSVQPGTRVALRFIFSSGLEIEYDAPAIAAADPVPQA